MISILHLEDDPRDAELVQYELSKLGQKVRLRRVYDRADYVRELEVDPPDLILADHRVPSLETGEALRLANELAPGIPFILITGTLDDAMAVSYLKAGAVNYILKDHLARLLPAVESALVEAERERQLRWQRSLLQEVLSAAPSLITVEDAAGRLLLANRAVAEAHGVELDRLLESPEAVLRLPDGEIAERERRRAEVLAEGRVQFSPEEPITRSSGDTRWFQVVRTPLRTAGRDEPLLLTVATDISERRRLFEAIPDAVLLVAPDGRVTRSNEAAERLFGLVADQLVGRAAEDLLPGLALDGRSAAAGAEPRLHGGRQAGEELAVRDASGGEIFVEIQLNQVALAEGLHRLLVIRDVTARRDLERQLRMASRMESVGRLAGGVAHDFNNLLMVILAQAELMLARGGLGAEAEEGLEEIVDAARRGGALTRQLLAFSRKQVLQPRWLDLNVTVTTMETLLARVLGEDVTLISRLAKDLGTVRADPGQIEQVLMNLAVNSRDAMPDGGKLAIETQNVEILSTDDEQHRSLPPGSYVMLAVSDDGHGMDEETQASAFEPFFTTKGDAGTGLGLATVYGVVKQSGGFLWLDSAPGRGTRLEIFLPRYDGDASWIATVSADSSLPRGGSETILLVEDEERLRRPVRKTLERYGYTVIEAGSCAAAVEVAAATEGEIDLLFTDVVLPDDNGTALASRLRPERPRMEVLFTSGYAGDALADRGTLDLEMHFLQKPYSVAVLAARVREILDSRTAARATDPGDAARTR